MKNIFGYIIVCSLMLVAACSTSNDDTDGPAGMDGQPVKNSPVSYSGCKQTHIRSMWKEEVWLKTINGKLQINHIDAIFSCEPGEITVEAKVNGNKLIITEIPETSALNCICPADLLFTVELPSYGVYELYINEVSFGTFSYNADTDVKLALRE